MSEGADTNTSWFLAKSVWVCVCRLPVSLRTFVNKILIRYQDFASVACAASALILARGTELQRLVEHSAGSIAMVTYMYDG